MKFNRLSHLDLSDDELYVSFAVDVVVDRVEFHPEDTFIIVELMHDFGVVFFSVANLK